MRLRTARRTRMTSFAAIVAAIVLAGCTSSPEAPEWHAGTGGPRTPVVTAEPPVVADEPPVGADEPPVGAARPPAKPAPGKPFPVGMRTVTAERDGRSLRSTVWYPAAGKAGDTARRGAKVAGGEFPVVVFSHGLNGTPFDYRGLLTRWAAAGFVVVGPAYPHTSRGAAQFNLLDVVKQPADASQVLTAVLALDGEAGDPLRNHLDDERVAAAGHSAGGITTVGLFTLGRDDRFDAGVVLAGSALGVGTRFAGPAAPLLFVHGANDPLVSLASGKQAFEKSPWPKAFLTLPAGDHAQPYLDPAAPAWDVVARTTTDFLRWSLYGDPAARKRLAADARRNGLGVLDDRL